MTRHCLQPWELAALKRDGIGWGHDLECGCFELGGAVARPGLVARLRAILSRWTR